LKRGEFSRPRFREARERGSRSGIVRRVAAAAHRIDRRDIDDTALPLRLHRWQYGLSRKEAPFDFYAEHFVKSRLIDVLDRSAFSGDACVVHQHVNSTDRVDSSSNFGL